MKNILMALGLIAVVTSPAAMAQGFNTKGLMFGGTVGLAKPHGPDSESGVTIGGRLAQPLRGNVSWEADVNFSVIDGEVGSNKDWDISSVAAYGVYRSEGDIHLKGKLGLAYSDDDFDDNDTSLSAGIGLGFRLGGGILDVEYTQINTNADYVTVGFTMPF